MDQTCKLISSSLLASHTTSLVSCNKRDSHPLPSNFVLRFRGGGVENWIFIFEFMNSSNLVFHHLILFHQLHRVEYRRYLFHHLFFPFILMSLITIPQIWPHRWFPKCLTSFFLYGLVLDICIRMLFHLPTMGSNNMNEFVFCSSFINWFVG